MGIINVGINEKILNIEYPITIAGMSGRSLGYNSGKPKKSNSERDDIMASAIKGDNIGIHLHQKLERSIPSGATNNIALYHSILRAIERGALSYYILSDVLDMKAIFSECLSEISILDEEYDRLLHYARYQAYKQGKEFLEWFDTIIYSDQVMPRYINTENKGSIESKTYKVGENSLGGEIIDASDYNVTNIYEAVELFKEKTCLL